MIGVHPMFNQSRNNRQNPELKLHLSIIVMMVIGIVFTFAANGAALADQKVSVTVTGFSWDGDSYGFAYFQGLSEKKGAIKAGRRGSRISVDGQPDRYAIAGLDANFEITFETDQPTFRLIVEGDRFPRTITQHYKVPKDGGDIDVGLVETIRAEGPEHTWPLPIVAAEQGYGSSYELLADNNAAIRILTLSTGEEGIPDFANNSSIEALESDIKVYPYEMDTKITFLQMTGERLGAFIIVVPFSPGEPADKEITLKILDSVSEPTWNPPRPWIFDPVHVWVRNGFATDIIVSPSVDQ